MNNLEYICKMHVHLVGSIFEDLACDDSDVELGKTLRGADFPESAFGSCSDMEEWLESEREAGAWEPNDSPAKIVHDTSSHGIDVRKYLELRGIDDELWDDQEAERQAFADINLRWAKMYNSK